jgi:hypothetical protein
MSRECSWKSKWDGLQEDAWNLGQLELCQFYLLLLLLLIISCNWAYAWWQCLHKDVHSTRTAHRQATTCTQNKTRKYTEENQWPRIYTVTVIIYTPPRTSPHLTSLNSLPFPSPSRYVFDCNSRRTHSCMTRSGIQNECVQSDSYWLSWVTLVNFLVSHFMFHSYFWH